MIRRPFGRLAFLIALNLGAGPAWTAAPPGEYQIKAAYLLNFARYVEWPAARLPIGALLRLCVLGRDPFGGALMGLEGRQVNGHEMRLRQIEGVDQAGDCHLVFIAEVNPLLYIKTLVFVQPVVSALITEFVLQ